jgi:Zn finger protein HypA/HybF involved in hydrogenase expression
MKEQWAIMMCEDCGYAFAIQEEPNFQSCPKCGGEETTGTGEYLDGQLYTESGRKIG